MTEPMNARELAVLQRQIDEWLGELDAGHDGMRLSKRRARRATESMTSHEWRALLGGLGP